MKSKKVRWITNPTKKQAILISALWITGVILLIFAITNFFTENPFRLKNGMTLFLIIFSSFTIISVCRNYRKNKRHGTAQSEA